jgi:hypothetical protein
LPQYAAMIAVLIIDRPLCVKCLSDKSGLTANQVESYLDRVRRTVSVERGVDLCRRCGKSTTVYSILRAD